MVINKEILKERKEYLIENGFNSYVLFTMTGNEIPLVNSINEKYENVVASPLQKLSHVSKNGKKTVAIKTLLGGYVFVYMPFDQDPKEVLVFDQIPYRILGKKDQLGKLTGEDYQYSKWVLDNNGLIGMSLAVRLNDKVQIISGPLKSLEGKIVEYSKKNRNCKVEIEFAGQVVDSWLPFEWVIPKENQAN